METNKKLMKVGLLIALLVAFMVPGSPAGPAVATHGSETETVCAEDAQGEAILCVSATRDPHTENADEWTGWCEVTDARDQGDLTCTDSACRQEECDWGLLEDGCGTEPFPYVHDGEYLVKAVGCMNPTQIDEEIEIGPVRVTVEEAVSEAGVCITVTVPGASSSSSGSTERIILH